MQINEIKNFCKQRKKCERIVKTNRSCLNKVDGFFVGAASIYVCMCWFGSCCDYHFFCSFGETLKWSSRFLAIIRFMVQTVFNKINWIRMIARSKWFIHKRRRCAMQPQNRDWYANTYFFWNVSLMQTKNASYDWHHSKCVDIILNELVHLVRPQLHARKRRKIQTLTKWKWKFPRKMFWWKVFSLSDAIVTVKTKLKE